jgi:hypothetical protein
MLTREEAAQIHALRTQGCAMSVIARRLGCDRKTVHAYLTGRRIPGLPRRRPDPFLPFLEHCRRRLEQDPHLPAAVLFRETTAAGYQGGYSTFTRALRRHSLRPHDTERTDRVAAGKVGPVTGGSGRLPVSRPRTRVGAAPNSARRSPASPHGHAAQARHPAAEE